MSVSVRPEPHLPCRNSLLVGTYLLYANWKTVDLVAAVFLLGFFHLRVVRFEEPELRKLHGTAFEEYCRRVPRWLPRLATQRRRTMFVHSDTLKYNESHASQDR